MKFEFDCMSFNPVVSENIFENVDVRTTYDRRQSNWYTISSKWGFGSGNP